MKEMLCCEKVLEKILIFHHPNFNLLFELLRKNDHWRRNTGPKGLYIFIDN
jgi:hypothetical protein